MKRIIKKNFIKATLLKDLQKKGQLPFRGRECYKLDKPRVCVSDSGKRHIAFPHVFKVAFQPPLLAISKGIECRSIPIKAICDPIGRGGLFAPVDLPAMIEHMYSGVRW